MTFRFRYRKCAAATFLAIAFVLSIISNLDCTFVKVDVGFIPSNTYDYAAETSEYGIGLWTIEQTRSNGLCIMPMFLGDKMSLTKEDDLYASFLMSEDVVFTASRFLALFGCIFGLIDLAYAWAAVFSVFGSKGNRVTLNLTLAAFICEGAKIALIFMSDPCTAEEFWEELDPDEVSTFHSADQCWVGRGSIISAIACAVYFSVVVYATMSMIFRDYSHDNSEDRILYDEISVPSFMQSVGSSNLSSKSRTNQGPQTMEST
mmetsp:Transcript_11470/g.17208  ORF Transcript_11470/g.17208 Transcript_11470/m.17208 type:complete len:261 (-) Transcript_11470:577-1359(-)